MMAYFNQIKIEFKDELYEPVNWLKANEKAGSTYESIEVSREYLEGQDQIEGTIEMHLLHHPKKFRLSPTLAKVLGVAEETRANIVGALW